MEQYAQPDPVPPVVVVASLPLDDDSGLAPLPALRISAVAPLLVHSPPDLFLRNSALLI